MILKNSTPLVFLFVLLFLLGCKTDPSTTTQVADTEVPALIKSRLRAEPDGLFPLNTSKAWSFEIVRHLFLSVLYFSQESLTIEPVLCKTRPEITAIDTGAYAGGMKLKFELLEEATWDNGSPITAHDYAFTLKAIFNPEARGLLTVYKQQMDFIKRFDIDPNNPKIYTITTGEPHIKTEENSGTFILPAYNYDPDGLLASIDLNELLDEEKATVIAKENENLTKFAEQILTPAFARDPAKIVGSGPYKIEEWIEGEKIILVKKENWWGDELSKSRKNLTAYPKSLSFAFVRDNNATLAMLKNNELDIAGVIESNSFNEMKEDPLMKEKFDFDIAPTSYINYMGINNSNPKLSDARVRQAISYLLDRNEICKTVYAGYAEPIYTDFSKLDPYYKEYPTPYNVDKAITLLEEAGWEDKDGNGVREKMIEGKNVELKFDVVSTPNNVISESIIRIFAESCKKAGMLIGNTQKEAREYIASRNRGEYELFAGAMRITPGAFNPSQFWDTRSATNYFKSGSVEMDNMIDAIIKNQDESKFPKLYENFQKAMADMQPVAFMVQSKDRIIVRKGYNEKLYSLLTPTYQLQYFR